MIGQDWVTCSPLLLRGKGKILGLHLPPESQGWGPGWGGGGSHFPRSGIQFPGARSGAAGKMQMPDVHAQTKSKVGSGRAGWTRWLGPARGMHGDPAPSAACPRRRGAGAPPVQSLCGCPGASGLPSLPPEHTLQTSALPAAGGRPPGVSCC